jgi:hypothetical protein
MIGRFWGRASPFIGVQLGNLERAQKYGLKGLWRWSISFWEFCEGNLERGLPCWRPWRLGRKVAGDMNLFP